MTSTLFSYLCNAMEVHPNQHSPFWLFTDLSCPFLPHRKHVPLKSPSFPRAIYFYFHLLFFTGIGRKRRLGLFPSALLNNSKSSQPPSVIYLLWDLLIKCASRCICNMRKSHADFRETKQDVMPEDSPLGNPPSRLGSEEEECAFQ